MKVVSFNVAKAIHEAGGWYEGEVSFAYDKNGTLYQDYGSGYHNKEVLYLAPTYLNVWLWLCREKKVFIDISSERCVNDGRVIISVSAWDKHMNKLYEDDIEYQSPEEAIIATIEALVDENMIDL